MAPSFPSPGFNGRGFVVFVERLALQVVEGVEVLSIPQIGEKVRLHWLLDDCFLLQPPTSGAHVLSCIRFP